MHGAYAAGSRIPDYLGLHAACWQGHEVAAAASKMSGRDGVVEAAKVTGAKLLRSACLPTCLALSEPPQLLVIQAVSGVQRRTWDKQAAATRAVEKDALAENPDAALAQRIRDKPVERNPRSRDASRGAAGNTDYMSQVGKVKMTTSKDAAKDRVGAFHCPLTGKTFSDDITYLDHINGKKYQKELGMNMRCTVDY